MNTSIKVQKYITLLAIVLFSIRIIAWWMTKSVAIFTDALDSIINIITGFIGWYSVWLSKKPRDLNHPYGHGKVEYISAAIEGTLISIAGLIILYNAGKELLHPVPVQKLDWGLVLLAVTGMANGLAGIIALRKGKMQKSPAVQATGHHLVTDVYSTFGIILGLLVMKITGWLWLDVVIAIVIAIVVLFNGYKVLRPSLAGIMDEADMKLLTELIEYINANRRPQWIGLHNLRVIKNGNILHLDGHLTLPWYYTVLEAHGETKALDQLIRQKFGDSIEMFFHVDYCMPFSCEICQILDCPVRQRPFKKRIEWTVENVLQDKKHNSERANPDSK